VSECACVVEYATEGPCSVCGLPEAWDDHEGIAKRHPYRGAPLRVCGHPLEDHFIGNGVPACLRCAVEDGLRLEDAFVPGERCRACKGQGVLLDLISPAPDDIPCSVCAGLGVARMYDARS